MADEPTTDPAPEPEPSGAPDATEPDLGDAGKKALTEERNARKAAEREAKRLAKEHESLQARLAELDEANKSDQQKMLEAATTEAAANARRAAMQAANARLLQAEVRAAAAGRLNDPTDAVRFLDLSEFEVGDDGTIDTEAISAAVNGLLTERPYLSASATRPSGSADGGANPGVKQLSRDALKGMSPEAIAEARASGALDGLLGR